MSINVTVTGNPISIKRGKMVTSDSYQAKKEFEKRRLMRLEQVRQQSKDIAENVRNKVRKEKKKQMREIEEEGKQKLKNWQNRKLLELQTQYEEALQELGTGHKEAMDFIDETEILDEQKKLNDKVATYRGQVAATELQIQKNKENLKKAIPIQQKKLVRDIENTRASLVSGIKKNKSGDTDCSVKIKKRKKPVADINITIPSSDSECSELEATKVGNNLEKSNVAENEGSLSNSCDCTDGSDNTFKEPSGDTDDSGQHLVSISHRSASPKDRQQGTVTGVTNLTKQIHERRKLIEEYRKKSSNIGPPLDTRISDRIKRRELMASQPDYCDSVAKTHPTPYIESNTQLRDAVDARNINKVPVEINCICGHKCPKICDSKFRDQHLEDDNQIQFNKGGSKSKQTSLPAELNTEQEIPEKPPVKLKEKYGQSKTVIGPSKDTLETYDSHKVKYYDHPNRFSQEKPFPTNAYVEKISSVEVIPDIISEEEFQQKMKQRDREAQIRGQKALEKERIQKDYEEMLKKLPLLQKKERICEIAKDKQEYHMSDERLKERDRKKQNELDNAFNKLFPNVKPAVVTLPRKIQEKDTAKLVTDEPLQSLNVGNWDVDQEEPKMFTIEEVQEIVQAFTVQNPEDRRAKLKQLLNSLKLQKEQLINEIKSLPANDSINELISDLKSFSDSDDRSSSRTRKRRDKSERKRRREERDKEASTDSTTESSSTTSSKHGKEKKINETHRQHKGHHHPDVKTPSPRKKQKIKSKRKVLVLQNMSTQTTPKPSSSHNQDKLKASTNAEGDESKLLSGLDKKENEPKEKPVCPKLHIPCDCNKENESTDELCHIVIKLNDNEDPEVVVKSKEKNMKICEELVKEKSPKHKKIETKSIGVGTDELKSSLKPEKPIDTRVSSGTQQSTGDKARRVAVTKHKTDTKVNDQKRSQILQVNTTESKAKSWKEQLSKNSISTSSTSYFSPPDFQKMADSQAHSTINDEIKHSLYNLHKKPQQSNFRYIASALSLSPSQTSIDQGTVDSRLLTYVQKLLSMSRGSVENLTASTSSVQTPSQSVIEMESNNPLAQLHNIIKHYNLKDIERHLSYSPDFSPVHYNTSASTSEESQPQPTQEKNADLEGNHFSKSGKVDQSSKGTIDRETSSCSAKSKDSVLAQYADITDSCSKRIAQLAAMIEQLREEKIQLMQHSPVADAGDKTGVTDKDYSTAYLELPGSNDNSSKYSSVNSLDDEELQRRLLDIDFSLAEKLRKFTSIKQNKISDEEKGQEGFSKDTTNEGNNTNAELWSRLHRLTQQKEQRDSEISSASTQTSKENLVFVPFLSDIPKLPKLEVQPENTKSDTNSSHKRPPPSRGLSVAKKFNGNISLVPHELSTIVEADSQLSTKLGSANNSRTSQDISPRKDFELVMQPELEVAIGENSTLSKHSSGSNRGSPSQVTKVSLTSKEKCDDRCTNVCSEIVATQAKSVPKSKTPPTSPVLNLSSDGSNPSVILTCSKSSTSKKSFHMSSSSSDDMEAIESMLRSIGMEWAIPTLHKTKEALALTSSSSSLELSAKKQLMGNSSSGSEVSLKQYLKKQIRISSSTLKSDASPASFSPDLSELSSIQANNSNVDKSNQKTSTPIISSKSTERSGKKVVFSADSDISSVRDESQKHSDKSGKTSYRSLSEYSQSKSDI